MLIGAGEDRLCDFDLVRGCGDCNRQSITVSTRNRWDRHRRWGSADHRGSRHSKFLTRLLHHKLYRKDEIEAYLRASRSRLVARASISAARGSAGIASPSR